MHRLQHTSAFRYTRLLKFANKVHKKTLPTKQAWGLSYKQQAIRLPLQHTSRLNVDHKYGSYKIYFASIIFFATGPLLVNMLNIYTPRVRTNAGAFHS